MNRESAIQRLRSWAMALPTSDFGQTRRSEAIATGATALFGLDPLLLARQVLRQGPAGHQSFHAHRI